jgi:serine phosphatase RsbU (regulator of sigma subunit)
MHDIPKLLDIAYSVPIIEGSTPTASVMDLFSKDSNLIALPVTENKVLIGIVRKSQLYKVLSKAFALDIYSRRPVRTLLDRHPIYMNPELDIHSALALLLQMDPLLEADSITLVSGRECRGIVSVSSLMMSISQNQSQLLRMLENLTARIRDELEKAAQIQQTLLPSHIFSFPGIELAADLRTCTELGGDIYDYFLIDRDRLCLVVADVSGHGVQAGMMTTATKASLHTLVRQGITTPGLLLSGMNGAILATTGHTLLMTCIVAIISLEDRLIRYANAGHNFPYLYRKGMRGVEMLENSPCFPLGFDASSPYEENTVEFSPGDALVLYSDGVPECSNGSDDYGYKRFKNCLSCLGEQSPGNCVNRVLKSLSEFRGNEKFEDDVTLVVARFKDTEIQDLSIPKEYSPMATMETMHD